MGKVFIGEECLGYLMIIWEFDIKFWGLAQWSMSSFRISVYLCLFMNSLCMCV